MELKFPMMNGHGVDKCLTKYISYTNTYSCFSKAFEKSHTKQSEFIALLFSQLQPIIVPKQCVFSRFLIRNKISYIFIAILGSFSNQVDINQVIHASSSKKENSFYLRIIMTTKQLNYWRSQLDKYLNLLKSHELPHQL